MCLIYETFLLTAVLFIAALAFIAIVHDARSARILPLFQSYLVIIMGTYFVWFWTHGRQTLAMKTWRLKIVAGDDHAPSTAQATARFAVALAGVTLGFVGYKWLGRWGLALGGVNLFWAYLDPDGQFLHDRLAKTRIVINPGS